MKKWFSSIKLPKLNPRRVALFSTALVAFAVASQQYAQAAFGFDDALYWSHQLILMEQHLMQLKNTALALKNAARSFSFKQGWETMTTQVMDSQAYDTRGENSKWANAINKFSNLSATSSAWNQATLTRAGMTYLDPNANANNSRNLAELAEVEQEDGAGPACMAALGQYKQNSTLNIKAIWQLMKDTFDPKVDAQEQQAEIQNAMGQQQHAEQMSQGALETCIAEQSLIESEHRRNDSVESLNTWEHVAEMGGAGSVPAVPSEDGWIPE